MSEMETYCAKLVKKYDYDRFLITLFAPAQSRQNLFSLYAFNHEVAKIREAVSEPMLGEIRLQWWRETIDGIYNNTPRKHEVVMPLYSAVLECNIPKELFDDIINARAADIYDENPKTLIEFESYLENTSGNLMRIAALMLGETRKETLSLANDVGKVWGLIGTLRAIRYHISLNKLSLPQDLMDQHNVRKRDVFSVEEHKNLNALIKDLCGAASNYLDLITSEKKQIDKNIRSLFLLTALSRSYLNGFKKTGYNPFAINEKSRTFQRQSRLFFSALFNII